jgi:hypothetical protein
LTAPFSVKLGSARNRTRCGTENRAGASCIRGFAELARRTATTPRATATEGPLAAALKPRWKYRLSAASSPSSFPAE